MRFHSADLDLETSRELARVIYVPFTTSTYNCTSKFPNVTEINTYQKSDCRRVALVLQGSQYFRPCAGIHYRDLIENWVLGNSMSKNAD